MKCRFSILVEETDARGHKTTYTVDGDTSRNEEVIDRLGNKTAYEYDASGRTTKVTSKKANGSVLANVSYSYDTFDNMTEIARGDGMKYALAYNEFHNLESIGIEGKSEPLIKYTYKNGNGRLKRMTYANGHTMKAIYNSIGQMVAEKWFETEVQAVNSTATPIAYYKYVYDGDGNIVRSIDISGKKEYNYEYEEGRIVRATEADIGLNGEIVTSKVIVNTVKYYYGSEGKMTKKVITFSDNSTHTVFFENSDNNTVVKFDVPNTENKNKKQTITSHSKTDSFGRKQFDELQLGTGFVSRQFSYMPGAITDAHKENKKIKSTATTQLVSQISLSDGRTISYEYDDEERIIKVIDSVNGTADYTYDALGQLLTEKVNDKIVNTMTYDNYGNIISKNGKQYCYDETWHDLLTCYNGQEITYDAQGNPTTYLGHNLTWEKGRQLKKFDNIEYTYNANGIRTSKKVNGVLHTYTLDGTKILRETWDGNALIPLYDNEDSVCGILYNNIPYYFIKNLQGDVTAIVDKDAQTVARYSYNAWGVPEITLDSSDCQIATINPFRYRCYFFDEDTKLYYLQSRYYDPDVGRFINVDAGEIMLSLDKKPLHNNLFSYASNNPINNSDHTGYVVSPANVIGAIIGGIIGAVGGYFLTRFLADQLGLSGWKRNVFIWGLTAVITAAAAVIGYFIGPYVAKAAKAVFKGLKKILVDNLKRSGCCFVAGTMVMSKDGLVPIEHIKRGDLVYSCNPNTNEMGYKKVDKIFLRETDTIVQIRTEEELIETTLNHPFWVIGKGWINSQDVASGDKLLLKNKNFTIVMDVRVRRLDTPINVYNFEVEQWHSYFVSHCTVLVHNANCGNELQQLKEAARKMGIKDQKQYKELSKYLHKWKRQNGMKAGDHLSWDDLIELIYDFLGL